MKIVIDNKTEYKTIDLRKLFCKALNLNNKIEGKPHFNRLCISVHYGYYTGFATIGYGNMRIRIPNYITSPYRNYNLEEIDSCYVAWLFTHELYHCRGFRHRSLSEFIRHYHNANGEWDWTKAYPINKKSMKEKPKGVNLQVVRYNKVCKMLDKKSKTLKRLQNQIKKWTIKKKYYERTLMAASKITYQQNETCIKN